MKIWPAPAKLNLFLHITGQREDGYHLLQTAIQFIDLCDDLTFTPRDDAKIICQNSINEISQQEDLCIKAAKLLHKETGVNRGIDIQVKKNIPLGAGLGGGSSDAATTLLALNQLWACGLPRHELEKLAIQLGADVPVFVRGHSCWVEGVGEELESITFEEFWYVVVFPNVHLNTQQMYADPDLTRNCAPIKIRDFLASSSGPKSIEDLGKTQNVFEPIARRQPVVERAFKWLDQHAPARLTGSGSGIFAACATRQQAEEIATSCEKDFSVFVTKGLNVSPVNLLSEYNPS